MMNTTQILNWDSNFFNKKIASVNISKYDEKYIVEKLDFYKTKDFDLIYLFVNDKELSSTIINSYNCKLVDTRVVYSLETLDNTQLNDYINVQNFVGNSSELYELGIQTGQESRYKMDNDFPSDDFKRLYKTWIDNSCNGKLADNISVYKNEDDILGYITLKKKGNVMSLILIATDETYRGKGIGKNLLLFAKKYSQDNSCVRLDVVTQKHNKVACHFYESRGMFLNPSQTNIYHVWLKKCTNNLTI